MEPGTVPREMPPLRCLRAGPARRYHREGQSPRRKLLPRRSRAPGGFSTVKRSEQFTAPSRAARAAIVQLPPLVPRELPVPPPAPGHRGSRHGAPRDLGLILTCRSNSVFSSIFALSFSPPPPPRLFARAARRARGREEPGRGLSAVSREGTAPGTPRLPRGVLWGGSGLLPCSASRPNLPQTLLFGDWSGTTSQRRGLAEGVGAAAALAAS
ncbi:unnamed protein product [Coccothraustes coccothraustes]